MCLHSATRQCSTHSNFFSSSPVSPPPLWHSWARLLRQTSFRFVPPWKRFPSISRESVLSCSPLAVSTSLRLPSLPYTLKPRPCKSHKFLLFSTTRPSQSSSLQTLPCLRLPDCFKHSITQSNPKYSPTWLRHRFRDCGWVFSC